MDPITGRPAGSLVKTALVPFSSMCSQACLNKWETPLEKLAACHVQLSREVVAVAKKDYASQPFQGPLYDGFSNIVKMLITLVAPAS